MFGVDKLESILEEDGIIFLSYGGAFTQSLIAGMTEVLEKEVQESNLSMKMSNNIFVVFIELAQNIMNYSKQMQVSGGFDPKGLIVVGKRDDNYFVFSKNIVSLDDKTKIESKIDKIKDLDADELKKLYREVRRSGKDAHSKGGGLGFIEVARKVQKMESEFDAITDDKVYFKFCATI